MKFRLLNLDGWSALLFVCKSACFSWGLGGSAALRKRVVIAWSRVNVGCGDCNLVGSTFGLSLSPAGLGATKESIRASKSQRNN